jgi:hypothetical protein
MRLFPHMIKRGAGWVRFDGDVCHARYSNKVTGFECPYLKSVGGAGPGGAW